MAQTVSTQVAPGADHTCALTTAGGVKCWGVNFAGQVGDSTTTQRLTPVDVTGLTNGVAAIAAGAEHTCALTTAGGVKCWGQNLNGQLGDDTTTYRPTPVDVAGLTSGVAAIAAGFQHTCALTTMGGVKCWGENLTSQLGDGTTTQRSSPVDVTGLTSGVAAIAAGTNHTCALMTVGGVKCWGINSHGQLGDGSVTEHLAPVDVTALPSGVAAIAPGFQHTCALTTGGGAKCWGSNESGQLGDNSLANHLAPVDVTGLTSGVVAIAAGPASTCALTTGGGVKCWGNNSFGQLGDNSLADHLAPADVTGLTSAVAAIAARSHYVCALMTGGGVKCWGMNGYGQLGDGTTSPNRATPVDVSGLESRIMQIEAGGDHACVRISGGSVKCWGPNGYGQVGDGTVVERHSPTDVLGGLAGVVTISSGWYHNCALTTSAGMKCWGYNLYGQIGDNASVDRWLPVDVSGLTSNVSSIAAGTDHTCAVTAGGAKCWGRNHHGQVGDNTTADRYVPVDVQTLGPGSGVTAMASGHDHTCAMRAATGTMLCWGRNNHGQLGNGTNIDFPAPMTVSGISDAAAIGAGFGHSCALSTGGGMKCWGRNSWGQLGDGTTTSRTSADNVQGLTSGVAAIVTGDFHTCALTTGGAMKCWGYNGWGQLGDGTTTSRLVPGDVTGLTSGVIGISAGYQHTCALLENGTVKCWGYNTGGQLGDGTTTQRLLPTPIDGGAQSIAFAPDATLALGQSINLSASATSGLPVAFDSWTPSTCTVSGNALIPLAAGLCGVRASQPGNGSYFPAPQKLRLVAITGAVAPHAGFNGDARSDVFWRDAAGGLTYQWQMNGLSISGQGFMPSVPTSWSVAGIGDANGGGIADVLWRDARGWNYLWMMNGLTVASQGYLPTVPDPWIVAGLGDASGDGKADVFWRNPASGDNYLWILDGLSITSQGYLPNVPGPDWEVVGVADFSGDARADVLWRNKATGLNYLWIMSGLGIAAQGYLPGAPTDWEVAGSPDANGDAIADVLWRNKTTGQNYLWFMNGLAISSQGYLPGVADTGWKVFGYGDYNGDGRGDVLWRHATTGQNYLWTLNGMTVSSQGYLPTVSGANWQPVKR